MSVESYGIIKGSGVLWMDFMHRGLLATHFRKSKVLAYT